MSTHASLLTRSGRKRINCAGRDCPGATALTRASIRRYREAVAAVRADHLRRLDAAMNLVASGEISPAEAASIVGVSDTTIRNRARRRGIDLRAARQGYLARIAAKLG